MRRNKSQYTVRSCKHLNNENPYITNSDGCCGVNSILAGCDQCFSQVSKFHQISGFAKFPLQFSLSNLRTIYFELITDFSS